LLYHLLVSIAPRLLELYRDEGISIVTGLNAFHLGGLNSAPFTRFIRNGENCTNGLGISLQEIFFLECLFEGYRPKRLFIIGNSFGWSTIALALLNPESPLVAMDALIDKNSVAGLELTNRIAGKAKLSNVAAVRGTSPQDVKEVLNRNFSEPPDFVFIDGWHTNKQVLLDFQAVRQITGDAVFLFHDVHEFKLHSALAKIVRETGWTARKLMATPSGMVILYPPAMAGLLDSSVLDVFGPSDKLLRVVEAEATRTAPRYFRGYLAVSAIRNKIRAWTGREPAHFPYDRPTQVGY
jgi:predicted O-methyltransferase YrrM